MFQRLVALLCTLVIVVSAHVGAAPAQADDRPAQTVAVPGVGTVTRAAITPDWLYVTGPDGVRALRGGTAFGPPVTLPRGLAPLVASAGRMITGETLFDRGQLVTKLEGPWFTSGHVLSGPYIYSSPHQRLSDVRNRHLGGWRNGQIFGTMRMLEKELRGPDGRVWFTAPEGEQLRDVWGSWVRTSSAGITRVHDWRNTGTVSIDPAVWGDNGLLGDGVYVTAKDGRIHVFGTAGSGTATPALSFTGAPLALERNRLAWLDASGGLQVSVLPVGGRTPALLLGSIGDKPRRSISEPLVLELDFSAPVAPGTLELRNAKNTLVRTIVTPASADGSLRLVWDVRDDRGEPAPNGSYTWRFRGKDTSGREVAGVTPTTDLLGAVDVARNQFATTGTPRYLIPCGRVEPRLDLPTTTGVIYGYHYGEGKATVTAQAEPGWVLIGQSSWTLPLVKQSCEGIVAAPTFVDKPGTYHDKLVIPKAADPVRGYEVNGQYMPAGEHSLMTGAVTVTALFEDDVAPMTWRHTYGTGGIIDVYTTPGEHVVNGRRWDTRCEPYSTTTRCFTNIWATTVEQRGSTFHQSNGWVFNNLTYMPIPRKQWGANPLANNRSWIATDGRVWRTECDTPRTGRNGCRSWIRASVVVATPRTGGGYTYRWETREVLNNMVRFS